MAHVETLCPEGLTYIFGCGHVGAATARVLTAAGFAVVACDDRPGTLTPNGCPVSTTVVWSTTRT